LPNWLNLEDKMMRASWVLEDIRLLRDRYNKKEFTWDELDNYLMALETIYQHRFDDLEDMMCQVFQLNEYAPDDVKAKRPSWFHTEEGRPNVSQDKVDEFYMNVEKERGNVQE
jgi:hypothetical protein